MRRKNIILFILLLSISFCFTACNDDKDANPAESEEVSEGEDSDDEETPPEEEDEWETTDSDTIMMTVGKYNISKEEVLFYMHQLKKKYEGSLGKDIWDIPISSEQNFGEYSRDEIQRMIMEVNIICQEAKAQRIYLDDDEKMEAMENASEYMDNLSEEEKQNIGFELKHVIKVYEQNMLAEKMYHITTADVNTNISDEDAREVTIQYIAIITKGTDKYGKQIDMSVSEREEAKKRAKKLLETAETVEDFKSFATQNTDASEVEITFGKGNGPIEFTEEAFRLRTGNFSPVIERDNGFYILRCVKDYDQEAVTAKKEQIIEESRQECFMKAYEEWSSNYEIVISKTQWETLRFL